MSVILFFLAVLATSLGVGIYMAYKSVAQAPTIVAPQEASRFFTFGGLRNGKTRMLSLIFHGSLIISLFGHFFIFVERVPPVLPKIGTLIGAVSLAALLALVVVEARRRGLEYLLVTLLTVVVVFTGVAMGVIAPREYLISAALSMPQRLDAATALLAAHVISASLLAALIPFTLLSHLTAPLVYIYIRARRRKLRRRLELQRMQVLG